MIARRLPTHSFIFSDRFILVRAVGHLEPILGMLGARQDNSAQMGCQSIHTHIQTLIK